MRLSELKINESLKVTSVTNGDSTTKRKLNDLGITRGVVITIQGVAPLGSPVHIKLRGYNLAIEKEYLECIYGDKL